MKLKNTNFEFTIILSSLSILLLLAFQIYTHNPIIDPHLQLSLDSQDILQVINNPNLTKKYIQLYGSKKIMSKLLKDSGNESEFNCHKQAHIIGRFSYELYGYAAFKDGNLACHSGYYHGAMESLLKTEGTSNLEVKISEICNNFKTPFANFECLHGIGHGVLPYTNYQLPEAIKICKEIKKESAKGSCFGGVFMENIATAQGQGTSTDHQTEWVKKDNYHFPCTIFGNEPTINLACYSKQTTWMLTISSSNLDKVISECLKAPDNMISTCFKSLGRDIAGLTNKVPQKIKVGCDKVPKQKDYYESCIMGGLYVILDFFGPEIENRGTQLCMLVPQKSKKACYSTLYTRLQNILPNSKKIMLDSLI